MWSCTRAMCSACCVFCLCLSRVGRPCPISCIVFCLCLSRVGRPCPISCIVFCLCLSRVGRPCPISRRGHVQGPRVQHAVCGRSRGPFHSSRVRVPAAENSGQGLVPAPGSRGGLLHLIGANKVGTGRYNRCNRLHPLPGYVTSWLPHLWEFI